MNGATPALHHPEATMTALTPPRVLRRLHRILVRGTATLAATVVGCAALGVPSHAASAEDFPSMDEVVTLLPGLAGGHSTHSHDSVALPRYYVYDRGPRWCGYRSVPTRSSETTTYAEGAEYVDQDPIELTIHDLGSVTRAKKVLASMRSGFASCEGSSFQNDGQTARMRGYDLTGGLPKNHLAYRVQLGDGFYETYSEVFVRVGDRILHSTMDDWDADKTFQQQMAGAAMASLLLHTS